MQTPPTWISMLKTTCSDFKNASIYNVATSLCSKCVRVYFYYLILVLQLREMDIKCWHSSVLSNYRWTFKKLETQHGKGKSPLMALCLIFGVKITAEAVSTHKNIQVCMLLRAIPFKPLTTLLMGFHLNWKNFHSMYIITTNIFATGLLS